MTSPCRGALPVCDVGYRLSVHANTPQRRLTIEATYDLLPMAATPRLRISSGPFFHPCISSGPSAVRFAPVSRARSDTKTPGQPQPGRKTVIRPPAPARQVLQRQPAHDVTVRLWPQTEYRHYAIHPAYRCRLRNRHDPGRGQLSASCCYPLLAACRGAGRAGVRRACRSNRARCPPEPVGCRSVLTAGPAGPGRTAGS